MRFEVEIGQRRRTIELQRSGAGWAVTLDGHRRIVDLVRVGDRWSMLVRETDEGGDSLKRATDRRGASHEVAIESRGRRARLVQVDGHVVAVELLAPGSRLVRSSGHATDSGPATIVAPMPGRVVKVLVTPGTSVTARQGLVVVEAMKMENELRAPRAGTVTDVRVREGSPVEANAVLVVIT